MKFKRIGAMFLAVMLCVGVFSATVFAYTEETEPTTEKITDVAEDAEITETESKTEKEKTGRVVTGGSQLNVRTGAGMNYEIIDHLSPGEEVSVIGMDGDWYKVNVPAKTGYVHSDYLEALENAANETDMERLQMFGQGINGTSENGALTPDGNMSLLDDYGSPTGEGKQFITLTTKNGNTFYLIIDRDDKGSETVHFLNLVDEADLLALTDENSGKENLDTDIEPELTEPEPTPEPEAAEPEPEKEKPDIIPVLILVLALAAGGGFFAFQKLKGKKEKVQKKPDPDADYVDDDEDYGYVEADEDMEDEEEEIFNDDEDNEPV